MFAYMCMTLWQFVSLVGLRIAIWFIVPALIVTSVIMLGMVHGFQEVNNVNVAVASKR